jgi:hypothetical protein
MSNQDPKHDPMHEPMHDSMHDSELEHAEHRDWITDAEAWIREVEAARASMNGALDNLLSEIRGHMKVARTHDAEMDTDSGDHAAAAHHLHDFERSAHVALGDRVRRMKREIALLLRITNDER